MPCPRILCSRLRSENARNSVPPLASTTRAAAEITTLASSPRLVAGSQWPGAARRETSHSRGSSGHGRPCSAWRKTVPSMVGPVLGPRHPAQPFHEDLVPMAKHVVQQRFREPRVLDCAGYDANLAPHNGSPAHPYSAACVSTPAHPVTIDKILFYVQDWFRDERCPVPGADRA